MQQTALAAILIDADNLQDEVWLEAVREQVKHRCGRLPVIRAYGSTAKLQSRVALWARLGAEMVPTLPLDKNTTDASLMVDAVELCCRDGVRLFAIASGDADFAPLAVRLRARGCEVWCFAVTQTLFNGAQLYYDKVVRFERPPGLAPVSVTPERVPALAECIAPYKLPALSSAQAATSLPIPKLAVPRLPSSGKSQPVEPSRPALVSSVLKACPALRGGQPLSLSLAIPLLRREGLIGQSEKPKSWAAKLAPHFQLMPASQPNAIRYVARPIGVKAGVAVHKKQAAAPVRDVDGPRQPRVAPTPLRQELHVLRSALWACAYLKVSTADVLFHVPELLDGKQRFSLSSVASRLRMKGMLAPPHSALKILDRFPASFEVDLATTPQSVRYIG